MGNFEDEDKKARQIENLENLVERHTRTQRHLEQYSEIGDPENKENARKVQKNREEQINELEKKLINEDNYISPEQHLENLKENYKNAQGYIKNNEHTMEQPMLNNLLEKQERREEQIKFLEDRS